MHKTKAPFYLLSADEKEVEAHLEENAECPWCCEHDDVPLRQARERALRMGYLICDKEED